MPIIRQKSLLFPWAFVHQALLYQGLILFVHYSLALDTLYFSVVVLLREEHQLVDRQPDIRADEEWLAGVDTGGGEAVMVMPSWVETVVK